jgi:hypothetical protein
MVVAGWLNTRPSSNASPAKFAARTKDERGICNDITGGLLCPIDYDWDNPMYVLLRFLRL